MYKPKVVIAHRGASGYLPEHTLAAKAMAYAQGADYLEQDIVLSKDNIPVVLHDIYIDTVTNVASVYPARKRADGRFYAIDFTLNELKQLSVTERFDPVTGKCVYNSRFPAGVGHFTIVSLSEELDFIKGLNKSSGHHIGIYPEIKKPLWHQAQGYDISQVSLAMLHDYGFKHKDDKLYLQCFSQQELQRIRYTLKSPLPIIQLIAGKPWADTEEYVLSSNNDLQTIAGYANGIGPWQDLLINTREPTITATGLSRQAKKQGLCVHPYTVRKDDLPTGIKNYQHLLDVLFIKAGVDGVFTDFPDLVVKYCNALK